MVDSLWGDEFVIPETPKKQKKIIEKASKPKAVTITTEKAIKSKTIDIKQKIALIAENVYKILGKYAERTVVIKTKEQLHDYIDAAIANGEIAIDTETNNSLVPLTCKLMGPCIYTPGQKNAYIPINHIDPDTRERLPDQLTEADVKEEFERLHETLIIMHNAKFDYQVIKCTCDIPLKIYWDTFIGARLLNENEKAGLKEQYISKIDSSIEKYNIEHLFEKMEYAIFAPELFALYAATDAFMTYELYKWQKEQFSLPEHARLYNLFQTVEMPIVTVTAEMELYGVCIDADYASRLSKKYHNKLYEIDKEIAIELAKYDDIVSKWRLTPEANFKPSKGKSIVINGIEYAYMNASGGPGDTPYWYEKKSLRQLSSTEAASLGLTATYGKSKNEQLENPISVTSPTQLAILLYDILKIGVIDKKAPRGTGEPILEKLDIPLCKVILKKRGLEKIIGTYVDKLPECVIPKTGRLHASFLQIGADTGRFSSKDPNLQNIPSHLKEIRMLFKPSDGYVMVGSDFSLRKAG